MAEIPLYDENEALPAPRPRAEVRLAEIAVRPYPDGRRMKLHFSLTPFAERPSVDITVTNAAGHEVATLHLIEAMDDAFDLHERGTIEHLLEHKFQLSHDETQELLALAEQTAERSHQLHPFTRLAVERMEPKRRIRLIEMLWEVAYAEFWFSELMWPDFDAAELERAMHAFRRRERRFGGLLEDAV